MGTITVRKAEAVAALRGDWLPARGAWARGPGAETLWSRNRLYDVPAGRCRVCAVGAVLRGALGPGRDALAFYDACQAAASAEDGEYAHMSEGYAATQAAEGKYLCALSSYYEGLPSDLPPVELVGRLVAFVEAHWPEAFEAEVGEVGR